MKTGKRRLKNIWAVFREVFILKKIGKIFIALYCLPFLMIFTCGPAFADSQVSITADKTSALPGEQVSVVISVKGTKSASEPGFPESDDYELYYRGKSSRFELTNGRFSSSVDFNYILVPLKKGRIVIPPIPVRTGSTNQYTQALTIQVAATDSDIREDKNENRQGANIFVSADADDSEAFVNQQIIYSLRLYRAVKIQGANLEPLEFEGFQAEKLGKEREYQKVIEGKQFIVTEIRYALFPQRSGILTIPPARLQCQVLYRKKGRAGSSPFDSFFDDPFFGGLGRYEAKTEFLSTQPIEITVKPLPAPVDERLATPLVGKFEISADLSQKQIKVGESATLTISISGRGNIRSMAEPYLGDMPEFKTYEDKPQTDLKIDFEGISGVKTFKRAIVPSKPGKYSIPAITLPYLDPDTGQYKLASTRPISLTVLPGAEEEGLHLVEGERHTVNKEKIRILGTDILPAKTSIHALRDQSLDVSDPLLLIILILPPLTFLVTFLWEKKKRHIEMDKAYYRRKKAQKEWKRSRKVILSLAESDSDKFYSRASNGLKQFFGDRLNVAGRALTPQEIDQRLKGFNVPEELRRDLSNHLHTLEMGEFGALHQGMEERKAILCKIDKAVSRLLQWI